MHLEKLLNILHYCFYLIDVKLHFLSNKINPFVHLGNIPFLKRRIKKQGIDNPKEYIIETVNDVWTNKENGFSIWTSGGVLGGSFAVVLFSLILIAEEIYSFELPEKSIVILILVIPSYLVLEIFIWRKDKYLKYFDEFEKWSKKTKRRNVLLSFGYLIGVIIFFFWSLFYK